jgi:hypothetical protein
MKTIAFHSNQLGIRGTEVALYDYAHFNETILGNKSYIISDQNKDLGALQKFKDRFEVFLYSDFRECDEFVKSKQIQYVYYIKAGDNDGKTIPGVRNLIHAVFQNKDVHGDRYAYVSKWLAQQMKHEHYVPHVVHLPDPMLDFRSQLGIPCDNIVIGRYGGYNEFDIDFAKAAVYKCADSRRDITFLFMNTNPFGPEHPNVIYVNGTHNLQHKANFINTCDYMIHARRHGESFGLAICEFLHGGKPVISWKNGLDKHHVDLLGSNGIWYENHEDLNNILNTLQRESAVDCRAIVEQFSPTNVMRQFDHVFLK